MTTAAKVHQDSASHWYHKDGKPCYEVPYKDPTKGFRSTTLKDAKLLGLLPSTTTILRMLDKPALTAWKIETACLAVLTSPRLASEELDAFVKRVLQTDKEQDAESAKARELGTKIHDEIENVLNNQGLYPELADYVTPTLVHLRDIGNVTSTEKIIVGDNYAGKLDAIAENDTHITVIDFKTCKTIPKASYDEHRLQLASYAAALGNTGRKLIRTANIYISTTNPGEVKTVIHEDWQETFTNGFEPLIKLWQWSNSHAPISSKVDIYAGA